MNEHERLRRLANLAGIESHYWDIQGTHHETSPETARALLYALGFPADDEARIAASLSALEDQDWWKLLPPVAVIREREHGIIPVHLPTDRLAKRLNWKIMLEDGTVRTGRFVPEGASLDATRPINGREIERRLFHLPSDLPLGYHALHLEGRDTGAVMPLIIAPARCYLPPELAQRRRYWGIATQLYAVRSRRNGGVGEFSDLGALVDWGAKVGAAAIGLNPLHALFPSAPKNSSPYSPSSRLYLNPMYLDVTAIPDFAGSPTAQRLAETPAFVERLRTARSGSLIDYPSVTRLKFSVLAQLYAAFRRTCLDKEGERRAVTFRKFQQDGAERLRRFAAFEVLSETFGTHLWMKWPEVYRNPSSDAVATFVRKRWHRIEFIQYLQWQADLQLAATAERAADNGMAIGLYGDLALSANPNGAEHWALQDLFVSQARIGAPPDPFNALGQEWGVAPINPWRLRETAYDHFIALLRANMHHAGALRIDHAMGLQHLFWVPLGSPSSSGAYVTYPFEDLLGILALESQRNECLVVGEDLGTVPKGFRTRMAKADVLSYRVLYFEKSNGRFTPPSDYPSLAAACISTHDLATLKGFWNGTDLAVRQRLGLYHSEEEWHAEEAERAQDRRLLLQALADEDLLPPGIDPEKPQHVLVTPSLMRAVHEWLARSRACLFMVQLDDLTGEEHQANLPGTQFENPNWCRRLSHRLEQLSTDPAVRRLALAIARERTTEKAAPRAGEARDT